MESGQIGLAQIWSAKMAMNRFNYPDNPRDAKAAGFRFYFTGKPCKKGHIAPRYTKGDCVYCSMVQSAAWYSDHREEVLHKKKFSLSC